MITLYHASILDRPGRGYYQRLSDGSLIPTSLKQGKAIAAALGVDLEVVAPARAGYGGGKGRRGVVTAGMIERAIKILENLENKK